MSEDTLTRRARIRGNAWQSYEMVGLGISVGKDAHEGEDFAAAAQMIVATNKPCLIRLSDTLQRHNLMAQGMDAGEAWQRSRELGTAWLKRNESVLATFDPEPRVIRWDSVILLPEFNDVLAAFVRLSSEHADFSSALNDDVSLFLSRRAFASRTEEQISAACSRAFLLEELAGQTLIGRQYSYAGFYPGKPAGVLQLVRDGKIQNAPWGLENTAFVKFTLESARGRTRENKVAISAVPRQLCL